MRKVKIINTFCGPKLFAGEAAAVMAPAGRTKKILPFFLPADIFSDEILSDGLPLVEDDARGARIFRWFCESVAEGFILGSRQFRLKCAEQLVPDDQEHTHVLIQVFHVRSMVDPVMRRGDQDILQPAHLADQLGMDENTPDLGGRIHEDDIQRLKAQQGQWNKIYKTVKRLEDR